MEVAQAADGGVPIDAARSSAGHACDAEHLVGAPGGRALESGWDSLGVGIMVE